MSEQQIQMDKVYSTVGRLTLQIMDLQETNVLLSQQVHDLSEQLQAAQSQLQAGGHTKKAEEVHEDMPVDQAIALLQSKGIPVSVDGATAPSMPQ